MNKNTDTNFGKQVFIAATAIFILILSLLISYRHAKNQPSDIILPGGVTYLGETPTPGK